MSKQQMLLVDGHGLAFRAFYALPEMNASDGTPTQAVVGFFSMLLKAISEWKPEYVALFFDPKGRTARKELYENYKEGRKPTPESFKTQLPLIIELARALGYPVFVREGIEADDLIASTAQHVVNSGVRAIVLSADKDMLQFLEEELIVARPSRGVSEMKLYTPMLFMEEYGFSPSVMADYLALVGDSVDNIPGVPGIGDKTARQLLIQYGSLEGIYSNIASLSPKRQSLFEEYREKVFWGRSLVLPVETEAIPVAELNMTEIDSRTARDLLRRLGLRSLEQRCLGECRGDEKVAGDSCCNPSEEKIEYYPCSLKSLLGEKRLVLVYDTEGEYPLLQVKYSALVSEKGAYAEMTVHEIRSFLSDWKGHCLLLSDYKKWCVAAEPIKSDAKICDLLLLYYLLHPDTKGWAGVKRKDGVLEEGIPTFMVWDELSRSSLYPVVHHLLADIDIPLSSVLARMERRGFLADKEQLLQLEESLSKKTNEIERTIYSNAGGEINLNSPKQVGELLFNQLRLPVIRKTKTGYSTDALVLEELAKLPKPLCVIPQLMLEYRELSKLQQSFVAPYLKISSMGDGCVRATFEQTGTGTGRLASHNPNVQNIPLFGDWAMQFRKCLVPADSANSFVSADYSQIELRVLAHLCKEDRLLEAFESERDIHTETASWVFGVDAESVTGEQRRFAKVVNFGLLYGMSAHGLAQRMGIARQEAARIVDRYFNVLPKVKEYLEQSLLEAKQRGYTRSLFGRVRPIAEFTKEGGVKGGALERIAINTPIQSAAADITKKAMIRLDAVLSAEYPEIFQVSQVHDSIICECPTHMAQDFAVRLKQIMEQDSPLDVPIKAEAKIGGSMADL